MIAEVTIQYSEFIDVKSSAKTGIGITKFFSYNERINPPKRSEKSPTFDSTYDNYAVFGVRVFDGVLKVV